jgi:subfamily B ATP-binding cassette protein MsbA
MEYSDQRIVWRLLKYGWGYKGAWLLMLLATGAMAGASGYLVLIVKDALDMLQSQAGHSAGLYRLGARLLVLSPLAAVAYGAAWAIGQHLANACLRDLRNDFLGHLVRLELLFHKQLSRGDLLTRITSDLDATGALFQSIFGKLLQRPTEALGTIAFLFYINWRFAAAMFVAFVPAALFLWWLLRRVSKRSRKARQKLADSVSTLEQITAGIKVIQAMGTGDAERERAGRSNALLYSANMRMALARAQSDALVGGLTYALVGLVLVLGTLAMARGFADGASILTFITALGRLTTLMKTGTKAYGEMQESLPAAARLLQVLDRPSALPDDPSAPLCATPAIELRIEDVRFHYGDGHDILHGVDLTIPVGKVVALVGESGSGKSTLLDLIARFHDVTGGRITLDGIDIRSVRRNSLITQLAIVPQDSFLFNDTIENNIRYGRPGATQQEVEAAARRAHVHDAILGLEGGLGYQTVVGDRGERLSGGQRQRIAIARALLRDAPILLLDEPTSALDAESEHHVQAALKELLRGRTCIMIAHRLRTVQEADRIYVLSKGRVVESGSHRELYAQGGEYARLVKMQQLTTS